jgi:hypothetical protein
MGVAFIGVVVAASLVVSIYYPLGAININDNVGFGEVLMFSPLAHFDLI